MTVQLMSYGVQIKHLYDKTSVMRQNNVQSKLMYTFVLLTARKCREEDRSTVHGAFCVHYITQKVTIVLQFNYY